MMVEQAGPTYLIIGNGIAGVTAAEILRSEDSAATIAVVADDPFPVYYRPALKDYLAGRVREDKLWARPRSFYQDNNIYFHADRVVHIQTDQHIVYLKSGRRLNYTRLLLANGARAATLKCPGLDLEGVTTLRTVADYQQVLDRLNRVKRVVVSGSGTLALETIETLRHRGLAVTHLIRRNTLWSEVLDATASDLVLQQERRDGVDVRLENEVAEIIGKNGSVTGVLTTKGERISCEMVLIAIGVEPIIDFIKSSGIACGRGVQVDGRMRTNVPDIYAAGDVLETKIATTNRTRVIGQWYPAIQQARAAAYSMLDLLDTDRPFNASTFYNATFLYGLDFGSVGLTNGTGYQEVVADPQPKVYRKVLLKDGVAVGMLSLGDRRQALAFKRAIDHQVNLSPVLSYLFVDNFNLTTWLDQQGVPPARLGVTRQGEAEVKQTAYPGGTMVGATAVREQPMIEAVLVPLPEFAKEYRLSETRLSQTRVISIGRQPGIAVIIDQGTVSRRHAEFSYANGQYILRDLGSTNGTFVNGERLLAQSTRILQPNDQIRFGAKVKFTFVQRVIGPKVRKPSSGSSSMAGVTMFYDPERDSVPSGLPVLNPDGSLLLPGSETPVPAAMVATFKESPVLIVINSATNGSPQQAPRVFHIRKGKRSIIGRDENNDIPIIDVSVSRKHAEVFKGPDGIYVRDLGSSNGVIVNQARIDNPYRLSHGDRISIGGNLIYFIDLQAAHDMTQEVRPTEKIDVAATQESRIPIGVTVAARRMQATQLASPAQLIVCSQCGVANTRIARFCASCSAPLGSA
jgi:NADPH-dependent 2,4-dienoyl-CoA reductase/sulfur reductase-like enzyme/pSer/pThr/pTyr-binding forkhead associated (FHA) protein